MTTSTQRRATGLVDQAPILEAPAAAVFAFRLHAQHLLKRAAGHAVMAACFGGLQDSAPRAGVTSLHARTHGVQANDWDHPDLVQVWGPRAAVYLVPRADRTVFTLGRLPRSSDARLELHRVVEMARHIAGDAPFRLRELWTALGSEHALRKASPTGCIDIRWDARDTVVRLLVPPATDPEPERQELARRFLHWHGPGTSQDFALWAGISPADGQATFAAVARELTAVSWRDAAAAMLAEDEEYLMRRSPSGARLLPPDDPYRWRDRDLLVPNPELRRRLSKPGVGAILVDGQISGSWTRRGPSFTFQLDAKASASARSDIEAEAMSMPLTPAPSSRRATWVGPR